MPTIIFVCDWCFGEFVQTNVQQRLCPECVLEVRKKNAAVDGREVGDSQVIRTSKEPLEASRHFPGDQTCGLCKRILSLDEYFFDNPGLDAERPHWICKKCLLGFHPCRLSTDTMCAEPETDRKFTSYFRNATKQGSEYGVCEQILHDQDNCCYICKAPIAKCCGSLRSVAHTIEGELRVVGASCFRELKKAAKAAGMNTRKTVWE
jgi:hypothetical protein